jgi:hypothetical protein
MGRSLTREEAVDLFLSLRPFDELPWRADGRTVLALRRDP